MLQAWFYQKKAFFPALHIQFGLAKYFFKVMKQNFSASVCLEQKCPSNSKADINK
jgi:hypothetical protein